jgi:hypothetical protein
MRKINWVIVAVFLVLTAIIVVPFILQGNQKMDGREFALQVQSVEAATAEGNFLADHKDRQTAQYFSSQLEDLAKNVRDVEEEVEKKPYDPSLTDKRNKFIKLSKQTDGVLRTLSSSFKDEKSFNEARGEVAKLYDSLQNLEQSL